MQSGILNDRADPKKRAGLNSAQNTKIRRSIHFKGDFIFSCNTKLFDLLFEYVRKSVFQ